MTVEVYGDLRITENLKICVHFQLLLLVREFSGKRRTTIKPILQIPDVVSREVFLL